MSAVLRDAPQLAAMRDADLAEVVAVENAIYSHPWTRGNFADSLRAGYLCRTWRSGAQLVGYFVLLVAAGEAHLLNLSVAAAHQRHGHGSTLLTEVMRLARGRDAQQLFLEVRPTNAGAKALYSRFGFLPGRGAPRLLPGAWRARGRAGADARAMSRRGEILKEMGLSPVWRLRSVAPMSRSKCEERKSEQYSGRWTGRSSRRRSPAAPIASCAPAASRRCSASATRRPTGCWSARRRDPKRTGWASPSSGRRASCSTTCLPRSPSAGAENVYIANVLKCRPPGNRNPEPDEVAKCLPHLLRQIGLIQPKLILAMGRFASQALLGTDATIASLRGRVHQYAGVPLIVTYHPAYLLRNLPDKAKAWADLRFAVRTLSGALVVPALWSGRRRAAFRPARRVRGGCACTSAGR